MENIVRIENLIFEYAGDENKEPLRAIKGISLDIEAGTFTAIIGRNGSGKSTLAKCLNGLFVPTDGVIYVDKWDTADDEHIWDVRILRIAQPRGRPRQSAETERRTDGKRCKQAQKT